MRYTVINKLVRGSESNFETEEQIEQYLIFHSKYTRLEHFIISSVSSDGNLKTRWSMRGDEYMGVSGK
jgi:hypothetical protein